MNHGGDEYSLIVALLDTTACIMKQFVFHILFTYVYAKSKNFCMHILARSTKNLK